MKKRALYPVLVFGIIAILAAFALQGYYLWSAYQLRDDEFRREVELALARVAAGLEELNQSAIPEVALINQIKSNYYVVNVNSAIDANDLEFLLRKELERDGLRENFEYGIYDCYTDRMVYGDLVTYDTPPGTPLPGDTSTVLAQAELPTYDEYVYYFGVRFPEHRENLMASLGTVGALGAVLVITIAFFCYASYVLVRQAQLSQLQKDFINNMTHEFKTPLSTIKVASSVIARAPPIEADARLRRYADIIHSQNERLTSQVEKVLQVAKFERNRFDLTREPTDMNDLIADACQGARAKVEAAGGAFALDLDAPDRTIQADQLHLSGAISALLDNAIKYSPAAPDIRVSTRQVDGATRVTIADRGVGIAPEHRDKVFEKFYRVSTGDVHDVKGFGLGLFYVGGVARAHGYSLGLDADYDDGAAFQLDIPLREAREPFWRKLKIRIFGGGTNPPEWTTQT